MKYEALSNIKRNGKEYEAGDVLEINKGKDLNQLLEAGVIKEVKEKKTKGTTSKKKK